MEDKDTTEYKGNCWCKKIKYKVQAPKKLTIWRCNCSVCIMRQNHHFIVNKKSFTLLEGAEFVSEFKNQRFCSQCGISPFYFPRSNPDGVAVTIYCVNDFEQLDYEYIDFNGKNWDEEIKKKSFIKDFSAK